MKEFLMMNGYGGYIWSAYLISGLSLFVLGYQGLRGLKQMKQQLQNKDHHVS